MVDIRLARSCPLAKEEAVTPTHSRRFSAAATAAALGLAAVLLVPAPASGAEFTGVATEDDLREAINEANANGEADVIHLSGTGFTLTAALPAITSDITILGPTATGFVLDTAGLPHSSAALTISGVGQPEPITVTLAGFGIIDSDGPGETTATYGIQAERVNLTLSDLELTDTALGGLDLDAAPGTSAEITDVTVSGAVLGHGIRVDATGNASVTITRVTSKAGFGGFRIGATEESRVVIEGSTSTLNAEPFGDGGMQLVLDDDAHVEVRGTTIDSNSGQYGGLDARVNGASSLLIEHSTISGNTSSFRVGGIFIDRLNGTGPVELRHSTVTGNTRLNSDTGAGGVVVLGGSLLIEHSIIAGNTHATNAAANNLRIDEDPGNPTTVTAHHSLIESVLATDGATPISPISPIPTTMYAPTAVISGVPAELGPLADNGGPTLTHLPLSTSPVIDAGNAALDPMPAADQRGYERVVGTIDIGAVEYGAEPLPC